MLKLENISKHFKDFELKNIDLEVGKGDYCVLLGESGAGKSVLLEMISGLTTADSGKITYNGKDITNDKIQDRKIGILFQDYALFPHLSVFDNVAFALRKTKLTKKELNERVEKLLVEMNISDLAERKPEGLSGGEQQRVALARTLAIEPKLILLDEPFSSIDVHIKIELRRQLRKINREGITVIHVTHDFEEALTMASHIAVIEKGRVMQVGTPQEVFSHPKTKFIANLRGIRNYFKVNLVTSIESNIKTALISDNIGIKLHTGMPDGEGHILIRSRDVIISDTKLESTASNNLKGVIIDVVPARFGKEICVDTGVLISALISNESVEKLELKVGKMVWVAFKASSVKYYQS